MAKQEIPINNGFYESRSLPWSAQRCINYYPNYAENAALSSAVVFGTPGTELLVNTGETEFNRGAHVMAGIAYFVNGNTLYKLERNFDANNNEIFSVVNKGTIPGAGRISMADNGTQLLIVVPGLSGFVYNNVTDTLVQITDTGFTANGKSQRVVFIDGYFVHIAGKKIFHSELNDGLEYNALDFAEAAADPDDIVSSFVLKNQLFILGKETIEVFANVGKFPFTFQRIPQFFSPRGCFARSTPILFNGAMAFLGGGTNERAAIFWGSGGENFVRLSTTPIEQKLQSLSETDISKAFTWSYSEDGAVFLGITAGDFTFVYDAEASSIARRPIWHERRSTRPEISSQVRCRVQSLISAYERILVGDAFSGRIGSLSLSVFEEYGNFILRRLSTQPFANMGESIFVDQMEITVNSGTGNTNDPEPLIRMKWSDDNRIFNNEIPAEMGAKGQYGRRVYWRRLGRIPRFRTYEWSYSENTDPTLIKAEVLFDTTPE